MESLLHHPADFDGVQEAGKNFGVMSAGGAFGGIRGLQPIPPEKGVFPLDHFQECKHVMKDYLACLKDNKNEAEKCRNLSRTYLECRMEKNLMAKQDLSDLGFKEGSVSSHRSDGLTATKHM